MGSCLSQQETTDLTTTTTPEQENKTEVQQQQHQPQQYPSYKESLEEKIQQNNEGDNLAPQTYSDLLKKMNELKQMSDFEQNKEIPQRPISIVQSQIPHKKCNIYCSTHKDKHIDLINIDNKVKQKLLCYECYFQQRNEKDKIVTVNDFLNMTDNEYINNFLVFEEPLSKECYSKWFKKTKEIETSDCNLSLLKNFKQEINQYIDKQIQQVSESKERLLQKQKTLNQSFSNCNNLNKFQAYLRDTTFNHDKLTSNITELLNEQPKFNTKFVFELQEYLKMIQKEITSQQNLLDNFISQLNKSINNSQIFGKEKAKDIEAFQNTFLKGPSLLKDVSQVQKHKLNSFQSMNISLNSSSFISLKTNKSTTQINYINLEIDQNKKYEMLLDFKAKDFNQGSVRLYLSPKSTLDTEDFGSNISIPFLSQNDKLTFQTNKGISINSRKENINNLKIQIELKNRTLRWKFDDNINSANDWSIYYSDQPYYILFYSYSNENSEILIKQLKEVNEFEQW